MKYMYALALTAALAFGGMTIATSTADARKGGFGGAGGFSGRMGGSGFGGFRGGMSGPKMGGFSRSRSMGNFSPRMGNFNRSFNSPGRWNRGSPGNWGGNKWAGRGWSGKNWKHSGNWGRHHKRRFYGYPYLYAAPFAAGAYYYGNSYGSCDWLYDRAVTTGSSYWWSRYNECIYDY